MGDRELPSGNITVLFSDIEGSTRLIGELGESAYISALAEHRRLLRAAFAAHGGVEVDTQGDAFLYAFADAREGVKAAVAGQKALAPGEIMVRMGLHTGELRLTGEGYAGRELHRAARIGASGHGGQIVLSAATRALVDEDVTELGEHRFKDFGEPTALFQVGSQRFPPLKTISNTNLPRPASSLIGRRREREELLALIARGRRLVTLSGPGGAGKTRLALDVASELVPAFNAGVFWVSLSSLRDPDLVTQTIAQTLGAKAGLAEHISERQLLLLLDNFEQVVEAAPQLSKLLEACPNVRLLVTSRELLRIDGEVEYPVPPLAGPEAVELFCERSRLEPDETIGELCSRLDDLPLALELAAARTRVLSPAQILDRLGQRLDLLRGGRDANPRQQTLRATIEWSHDLLTGQEKQLFARLAVFSDGCSVDAAEAVCDAEVDVIQSLVEKSLLGHMGERFWMLETIHEFAFERLESRPESGRLRKQHAQWYLALAKSGGRASHHATQQEWLARLDGDLENIRSAIGWARDHDGRLEVELVEASWSFFSQRGRLREAFLYLSHALETAAQATPSDQAELLFGAAYVAVRTGDYAAAQSWLTQRLELARARSDARMLAVSLVGLAQVAEQLGDLERSRTLYLSGAEIAQGSGDTRTLAVVAGNLGYIALRQGDLETARAQFQQTLELNRTLSDPGGQAIGFGGLAFVALAEGDIEGAAALVRSSLGRVKDLGAKEIIFSCLLGSAEIASERREAVRTARLLSAADALCEEMGYTPTPLERAQRVRIVTFLDADDPVLVAAGSDEHALTLEEAVAYALDE